MKRGGGVAIVYPEPIQAFRFLVRVEGSQEISAAFCSFSGVRMQVETVQSRGGSDRRGVKESIPVFTSYAPVTLGRGVVGDNEFLEWMLSSSADVHSGPTGERMRRTIDVVTLNDRVLTERVSFAISGVRRSTQPVR